MEGPSLVIAREELSPFLGAKVVRVSGNTKQPKELLLGRRLSRIETWGKLLFLEFASSRRAVEPILTRTHFLLFGSYRIDDPKTNRWPRLELEFAKGTVYFYNCSLRFDGDEAFAALDHEVDLMSERWNRRHVLRLMAERSDAYLCDLFLDQNVFAGSGNIVKNEVLFNIRRHPLTRLSQVARGDWPKLADAVRDYCRCFYVWKKRYELRRHWQVYRQHKCPLCGEKLVREVDGRLKRKSFYCPTHQPPAPSRARARSIQVHEVLPMKTPPQASRPRREVRLDH